MDSREDFKMDSKMDSREDSKVGSREDFKVESRGPIFEIKGSAIMVVQFKGRS